MSQQNPKNGPMIHPLLRRCGTGCVAQFQLLTLMSSLSRFRLSWEDFRTASVPSNVVLAQPNSSSCPLGTDTWTGWTATLV